jgi:hypothetical protein
MIASYRELVDRIRGEIPELEGVVQRALRAWPPAYLIKPNIQGIIIMKNGLGYRGQGLESFQPYMA